MADPVSIPCVLMRGGTSRAAFFLRSDLPADPGPRDAVLIAAMGAGHELQVDGIGGGNPVTSKVAIVGPSSRAGRRRRLPLRPGRGSGSASSTLSPICGNILAAVGPFAIEAGLVPAGDGTTTVRIHNVNTGKIDRGRGRDRRAAASPTRARPRSTACPGPAAPIHLAFLDAAGAKTGRPAPDRPAGRPDRRRRGLLRRRRHAGGAGPRRRPRQIRPRARPPTTSPTPTFMARLERCGRPPAGAMGFPDAA